MNQIILHPLFSEPGRKAHSTIYRHINKVWEDYIQTLFLDRPVPSGGFPELKLYNSVKGWATLGAAFYEMSDIPFVVRAIKEEEFEQKERVKDLGLKDFVIVTGYVGSIELQPDALLSLREALDKLAETAKKEEESVHKLVAAIRTDSVYYPDHDAAIRYRKEQDKLRRKYHSRKR